MAQYQEVRTTQHEEGQEQRAVTFKATQIIWLFLGILEAVIAMRVLFKLIGVNAANSFATLLYNGTGLFVAPFASLAGAPAAGGMVLEISSILAMIIYLLIGWGLERIVYVLFYRPRGPVSVRQTTVAEQTPQQTPMVATKTTVAEYIPQQAPMVATKTTVAEYIPQQPPMVATKTTVTEQSPQQIPLEATQPTVVERTSTQRPVSQ